MASTTRQTAAARKRAAAKPTSTDEALDFEPIRIPANDDFQEERVPLFYIGDDEYTIPKTVSPGVALKYLKEAQRHGRDLATAPLLTAVLGEEAYEALEESKALSEDQMEWIVNKVLDLALGRKTKEGKAR